jgi:hypothetical protein
LGRVLSQVARGCANWECLAWFTFTLRASGEGAATLLFTHEGWERASEFMSGCSTKWGAYLTSLKTGAESEVFAAYPAGEISRWS